MQRKSTADAFAPVKEFRLVTGTYGNQANIYVNEFFKEIDCTHISVWFVEGGERFKHFGFILQPGKTRVTLTDLVAGKYHVLAEQYDADKKMISCEGDFVIRPPVHLEMG